MTYMRSNKNFELNDNDIFETLRIFRRIMNITFQGIFSKVERVKLTVIMHYNELYLLGDLVADEEGSAV